MKHKVAGISFQEENVLLLADENDDYSLSKRELVDEYFEGDKIYQYDFHLVNKAKLKPEPDNPHDQKDVAVYAQHPFTMEWIKIGYVKAGSAGQVDPAADYSIEMGGGPYKKIIDESVESGETPFWASIEESAQKEAPASSPSSPVISQRAPAETAPKKKKRTAILLCIFLGVFGAHKFYEEKNGMGILYLLTGGLFIIGWISDIFKITKYPDRF